jgi:hypothetical protein
MTIPVPVIADKYVTVAQLCAPPNGPTCKAAGIADNSKKHAEGALF